MQRKFWFFIGLAFLLLPLACNLPSGTIPTATQVVASGTATQTLPLESTLTFTPLPTATEPPSATPAPQNPLVLRATLCWLGPGPVYAVVSALKSENLQPAADTDKDPNSDGYTDAVREVACIQVYM